MIMIQNKKITLGLLLFFLLIGMTVHASALSLGEALNNTNLSWSTGSDEDISWFVDGDAVRSGQIIDEKTTWLETSVDGQGEVSFFWKVDSELGIDVLEFYIDDDLQDGISGQEDWSPISFPVKGAGEHTLKWVYSKDSSASFGVDAGWVDKVAWNDQPVAPIADFASDHLSGEAPLAVQFTDLSTGIPTSWSWTFGDGETSTEQSPAHTYMTPGDFPVSLVAGNTVGTNQVVKTGYIHVTALTKPVAAFSYSPDSVVNVNDPISFYSDSTGRIDSYQWSFGDGTPDGTDMTAMHQYSAADTYTVQLTVSNSLGSSTASKTVTIVAPPPVGMLQPVANFSMDATSGTAPLTVQFTDLSSNGPTSWSWTFYDDYTSSTLQNPVHTFTSAGTGDAHRSECNREQHDLQVHHSHRPGDPGSGRRLQCGRDERHRSARGPVHRRVDRCPDLVVVVVR